MNAEMNQPVLESRDKMYYPALTGVRAIAAWMVFFVHFNPFSKGGFLWYMAEQLAIGVAIFFVLSGFLISARYSNRITLTKDWFKSYMFNRIARIYPMYFILTCITFFLIQNLPMYDPQGLWKLYDLKDKLIVVASNLAFVRGFFDDLKFTGVAQGWTLTVEECFYISAPFVLILFNKKKSWLLVYAVALFAIGCALVALPGVFHKFGFMESYLFMYSFTLFGRCVEFCAGIFLSYLIYKTNRKYNLPIFTCIGFVWILISIWLMSLFYIPGFGSGTDEVKRIFINNTVLVPGICFLFYGLVKEESLLRRMFETKFFDLMGKSSYAFYLIHLGVLNIFIHSYISDNIIIGFVITNVVAVVVYKYIEQPVHSYLMKKKKYIVKQV